MGRRSWSSSTGSARRTSRRSAAPTPPSWSPSTSTPSPDAAEGRGPRHRRTHLRRPRPDGWRAPPGSSPSSSAATPRSSTSARARRFFTRGPDHCHGPARRRLRRRGLRLATLDVPRPPLDPMDRRRHRPTSTKAACSAPDTTPEPTTRLRDDPSPPRQGHLPPTALTGRPSSADARARGVREEPAQLVGETVCALPTPRAWQVADAERRGGQRHLNGPGRTLLPSGCDLLAEHQQRPPRGEHRGAGAYVTGQNIGDQCDAQPL